jgi:hypothetical protein
MQINANNGSQLSIRYCHSRQIQNPVLALRALVTARLCLFKKINLLVHTTEVLAYKQVNGNSSADVFSTFTVLYRNAAN